MKEMKNKKGFRSLLAGLLALVLALSPVLSALPAIQVNAAETKIWYHVEAGSGNSNGHAYSDASSKPAAVLLNQSKTMPLDGSFSVTYAKQGTPSNARFGVFYLYLDDNNWLYVGCNPNGSWYYEYKVDGAGAYPSLDSLESNSDDSNVDFYVALTHESLTVKVNDTTQTVNNQALYTLAEKADGAGKFGFRAGKYSEQITSFHFTNAKLGTEDLEGTEWAFLADCEGQIFQQEEAIPVYAVSGIVKNEKNEAIEGATVRVGEVSAQTAADGSFTVEDVERGTYAVTVSANGYQAYTQNNVVVDSDKDLGVITLKERGEATYENYIESDVIKAAVSKTFPQVYQYILKGSEKVFLGQQEELSTIKINNTSIVPTVKNVTIGTDNAVYEMTLKNVNSSIDLDMTVKISVKENDLTWEVTDITKNAGCVKINTIEVPKLNLATITDEQSDTQFEGANLSGNTNASGDVEITFDKGFTANNSAGYAYGFVSGNGVSAGVWSNSEASGDKRVVRNNGANSISLTSAAWYYEYGDLSASATLDGTPVSELPCAKVCLAEDENEDGVADWQDGAIAYRDIMNNPYGWENTKELVNYRISMNFSSQATNPYLKTADNIKKVYLATDGLPQAVMMKGYGSEGHDSANSEYGNIAERLGGVEDIKKLNAIAHQYNTQMGIHINAQEAYPEAQSFNDALINGTSAKGWGWLDQSYTINRPYDLASGLRYKRLLQLYDQLNDTSLYANAWPGVAGEGEDETVADAKTIADTVAEKKETVDTNLDFMYLDVWYGDAWETRKIAQQINSLGWRFSTEFGTTGEYDSTWQHWATEGSYGGSTGKGINSDVIRFIRNHQKDSFILNWPSYGGTADNPLLGGYDLSGFEGWGSNNNFNDYMTRTFAVNLPTKFLQHYEVYKWENYEDGQSPTGNHEKEITLKHGDDTVVVTRNTAQRRDNYVERTITLNGKKVLDDVTYLIPWTDSETEEEKLYHYNYDGGTTEWELLDGWKDLENVVVYKLTDTGRTEETVVPVTAGKVTLTAEANTPYVVLKGEEAPKTISNWGEESHVVDPGFNAYDGTADGTALDETVWTGDLDCAKVVRVRSGNKYLEMGSSEKDAEIATTLSGLKTGTNYVAQVYVDNKSEAKTWIEVKGGKEDVSNYTLRSLAGNYVRCDAHNVNAVSNSKMQVMLVSFTAKSDTATLILKREAGEEVTYFDDIRIVEKTLNNIGTNGTFTQDFESVVGGLYPFVMGPAQGVDDQVTHLSEKHAPYTQSGWGNVILDDVIGGKWSLKHHGSNSGIIYRTIPQNLHLEANVTYEVSFDYQAGCADSYRIVLGDGDETVETLEYLEKTAAPAIGQKSTTAHYTFRLTGSETGQSWFGLASTGATEGGSYGQTDFILDNLVVKETPMSLNKGSLELEGKGDSEHLIPSFVDGVSRNVTWSSSDEDVVTVDEDGYVKATGIGNAVISVSAVVDGEEITITCNVKVLDEELKVCKNLFKQTYVNTEEKTGEGSGNGQGFNTIDGDISTFWHTEWSKGQFAVSESNPAILTIQMNETEKMDGFKIVQRSSGTNGIVKKLEYVIGNSFDESTNTVSDIVEQKVITVDSSAARAGGVIDLRMDKETSAKYLQIRILNGGNGFGAIAEVEAYTIVSYTVDRLVALKTEKAKEANTELAEVQKELTAAQAALEAAKAEAAKAATDVAKAEAAVKVAEAGLAVEKAAKAVAEKEVPAKEAEMALAWAEAAQAVDEAEIAQKNQAAEAAKAAAKAAAATAASADAKIAAAENKLADAKKVLEEINKTPVTPPDPTPSVPEEGLKVGDTIVVGNVQYKVINAAKKTVAAVKGTKKKATAVKIADTVTIKKVKCKVVQINANAFKNYTKVKTLTIGKSVTSIGKNSFYGCKALTKVTFRGTAVKTIKSGAFKKTSSKKMTVSVPKSIKKNTKKANAFKKKLTKAGMTKKLKLK